MSKVTLVIGNRNYSSWSFRAWLCLRKCDVDFDERVLPLDTPEFEQEIGAYSPSRKVPVLLDDELCVWDSLAICEYANERFANGRLWPEDASSRGLGRCMAAEMHSGYPNLRAQLPMNFRAVNRRLAIDPAVRSELDRIYDLWADALTCHADQGPWLLGDFSIADAMFAPVVIRLGNYGVTVPDVIEPYVQQLLSDPDVQLWREQAAQESWIVEQDEAGEG